jgi:DNA repair photolyase
MSMLVKAGIKAGVGMAPILPGISDRPEQLAEVVRAAREANAAFLWSGAVYLKGATRDHFLETVRREWPEVLPEYEKLYAHGAYLRKADSEPIQERVSALKKEFRIADRRPVRLQPPPEPAQLELALERADRSAA